MKNYNTLGFASDVLSKSARTYLIDFFEEGKRYIEKNYNLIRTWQVVTDNDDPMLVEMTAKVQKAAETVMRRKLLPCKNGKIVDYVKGSWAIGHTDSEEQSHCSVITMIDLSQDLIGGEAYFAKDKESMVCHKMIPGPLNNGDSLMYGGYLFHGVDEVFSGRRLVLITWFLEDV
tara:strand:- start:83 stop:604 length:522 start_codon:yes stop_codon:yes gene_type:complete